jgi:hypothetical protein
MSMFKYDTATSIKSVTPDDSNDLPDGVCRALWIGGEGDVQLTAEDDDADVVISSIASGTLILVRTKRVHATSTTATNILALY